MSLGSTSELQHGHSLNYFFCVHYGTNAQLARCKYNSQIHLINGVACFSQYLHTALSVCSTSHVFSSYAKNRQ